MSRPRVQLRPAIAELMAAVRALPPLSMETVGAAARLALPQIGCSNLRWVKAGITLLVHFSCSFIVSFMGG